MTDLLKTLLAITPVVLAGLLQAFAIRFDPLPRLAKPLDLGIRFRGEPLFGANKTFRGVMIMALGSSLFTLASSWFLNPEWLPRGWPSLEEPTSALLVGLLMGLGYSLGELPNSFVKRQLKIPPGDRPAGATRILFYLGDQIDSVIGVIVVLAVAFAPPVSTLLLLFVVGSLVHILFDRLLYASGVKRRGAEPIPPTPPLRHATRIFDFPSGRGRTGSWGGGKQVRHSPTPHNPIAMLPGEPQVSRPFVVRLLIYLVERFSLVSALPAFAIQYLFIVHYVFAAGVFPGWERPVIGFFTFVGIFLILRFSDDLKDKHHDDRYYSTRPVQRGLVTTQELKWMLLGSIAILGVANLLTSTMAGLALFLAALAYLALMRFEFFIPQFLRPRLLLYLATHQFFAPILIAYVIYHNGGSITGLQDVLFVILNLLMIMAVEVARKIRPTALDQTGRDTYSSYLGHGRSILFLLAILVIAQWLFYSTAKIPTLMFLLLLVPVLVGAYYFRADSRTSAKLVLNSTVLLLAVDMLVAL